jgi:hypothetical protein
MVLRPPLIKYLFLKEYYQTFTNARGRCAPATFLELAMRKAGLFFFIDNQWAYNRI